MRQSTSLCNLPIFASTGGYFATWSRNYRTRWKEAPWHGTLSLKTNHCQYPRSSLRLRCPGLNFKSQHPDYLVYFFQWHIALLSFLPHIVVPRQGEVVVTCQAGLVDDRLPERVLHPFQNHT